MDLRRAFASFLIVGFMVATPDIAQTQSRPSGVASLGEMGCKRISGWGSYRVRNQDIPIGREIFRAVASLSASGERIDRDEPAGVACRLAPPRGNPQFNTLTLTFGLHQDDYYLDRSVVIRLSVYRDNNFYAQQTISQGDLIRLPVDVRGVRSLALEAECVRAKQNASYCPGVWFVEDTLRR